MLSMLLLIKKNSPKSNFRSLKHVSNPIMFPGISLRKILVIWFFSRLNSIFHILMLLIKWMTHGRELRKFNLGAGVHRAKWVFRSTLRLKTKFKHFFKWAKCFSTHSSSFYNRTLLNCLRMRHTIKSFFLRLHRHFLPIPHLYDDTLFVQLSLVLPMKFLLRLLWAQNGFVNNQTHKHWRFSCMFLFTTS